MSKLTELKEAIVKAVPEIMELKFGCEVITKMSDNPCTIVSSSLPSQKMSKGLHYELYSFDTEQVLPELFYTQDFEILGRPIRLTDVLLAIMQSKTAWMDAWLVSTTGSFWKMSHINGGDKASKERSDMYHEFGDMNWNLSKDSLEEQSEATIEFLHSILCGK